MLGVPSNKVERLSGATIKTLARLEMMFVSCDKC